MTLKRMCIMCMMHRNNVQERSIIGNNRDSDQPSQSLCHSSWPQVYSECLVSAFQASPVEYEIVSVAPNPPAHREI